MFSLWLGNEVSCGVGMQRIDVMLLLNRNGQKQCVPIELKTVEAQLGNMHQVQRYVDWIEQYYTPNMPCDVRSILISKKIDNKTGADYSALVQSFKDFNSRNRTCLPIEYIEYEKGGNTLVFTKIPY